MLRFLRAHRALGRRDAANPRRHYVTRETLDSVAQRIGIKDKAQWFDVDPKQVPELVALPKGHLVRALTAAYPGHNWLAWRFTHDNVPFGFWKKIENRRAFFDWLFEELKLPNLNHAYQLTTAQVHKYGGGGMMIRFYKDSLYAAVAELFPEHKWLPWLFHRVPVGLWEDPVHRRAYFDWLGGQIKIAKMEDWYNVSKETIWKHHGAGLLFTVYNDSVSKAIIDSFPEHNWLEWKFIQAPTGFWDKQGVRRRFFDWAAKDLGLTSQDDWYNVTRESLLERGAGGLLSKRFYTLGRALEDSYPEHRWDLSKFKHR